MKGYICPTIEFELARMRPSKVLRQRNNTIRFGLWKRHSSGSIKDGLETKETGGKKTSYFVAKAQGRDDENFNHDGGSSQEDIK